jgi:teichuronic acid exporter
MNTEETQRNQQNLKNKTISGMLWSFVERFGFLSIQFISNIVLARILSPSDFGVMGMILIFISLSTVMIGGGLGSALIQKRAPTNSDYSTIFFCNLIIAIIIYIILLLSAGYIGIFFHQDQLPILLKVVGVVLIFDSFGIVQNNILIKTLDFKKIARIKITAALFSSIAAIISAFAGLGVWSLVIQSITNSLLRSFFLWIRTSWKPIAVFSKVSFKELFGFGSKLLAASLLSELYRNFQSALIGRNFPAKDLGFFTQARQLEQIPVMTLATVVNQVTFPVFSELQNNLDILRNALRKSLKSLIYINFPVMVLLTVIAKPLFLLLFTEKWLPSVPYFQGLCMGFGWLLIVHNTNLNVLKSIGRSDLVLYLEIFKKIIGVGLIFWGIKYGILGIIAALAVNSYLEFFINGFFVGKTVGYGVFKQLKDILPTFILSVTLGFFTYFVFKNIAVDSLLSIVLQSVLFGSTYLFLSYMFKFEAFTIYFNIIKNKLKKQNT